MKVRRASPWVSAAASVLAAGLASSFGGCAPVLRDGARGGGRSPGASGALQIQLRESAGIDRRAEPVRTGLPFPPGALAGAANVRVVLSDGRETAIQTRAIASWPDGSLRWLELLFEPSVAAGAIGHYRVEFGPRTRPARVNDPLTASVEKGAIAVNTGRLRLAVDAASGRLQAWMDRNGDRQFSPDEQVLDGAGLESFVELQALAKDAPAGRLVGAASAELEEAGPLRASIVWRGRHAGAGVAAACPYVIRLYAFRGKSFVRIVHTLALSEPAAASRLVEAGVALQLVPGKLPVPGRRMVQEIAEPKRYPDLSGFRTSLRMLEGPNAVGEKPGPAALDVPSERFRLAAAVPHGAESAPWELAVEPGGRRLTAAFWPGWGIAYTDARGPSERGEPGFAEFSRTESFERFWKEPGPAHGVGAARTHELWLDFLEPGGPRQSAADFAARVAAPLRAWAGEEWLDTSGVFGRFAARPAGHGEAGPAWAAGTERLGSWLVRHQRERFGWLGLWDHGDFQTVYGRQGDLDIGPRWWNWHGGWGWMQGRDGLVESLLVPWLRSGRSEDWELFRAAAAHNLDVDTVNVSGQPGVMVGTTHGPGATHWSGPAALRWTYPAAWLDWHCLDGEPRALEMLSALVASLGGRSFADFGAKDEAWTADQSGYLRARLAAHEAFGAGHAAAAEEVLRRLAEVPVRQTGGQEGWAREIVPALIRYHRFCGDETAARLIERGMRAYLASRGPAWRDQAAVRNCYDGCAYAWRLTGDRFFLERGRLLAERSAARSAADAPTNEAPADDLASDARAVIEVGTLPYLEAALDDAR